MYTSRTRRPPTAFRAQMTGAQIHTFKRRYYTTMRDFGKRGAGLHHTTPAVANSGLTGLLAVSFCHLPSIPTSTSLFEHVANFAILTFGTVSTVGGLVAATRAHRRCSASGGTTHM